MQSHVTNLLFMGSISLYLDENMKLKWKYMINFQVGLLFYLYAVAFFQVRWPTTWQRSGKLGGLQRWHIVRCQGVTGSSPK